MLVTLDTVDYISGGGGSYCGGHKMSVNPDDVSTIYPAYPDHPDGPVSTVTLRSNNQVLFCVRMSVEELTDFLNRAKMQEL
jgi:hypothetical protein